MDYFETSISSVAFSKSSEGEAGLLAVTDSEATPNLSIWNELDSSNPSLLVSSNSGVDKILSLSFYPSRNNVIISCGEDHLLVWTWQKDKESGDAILKKRQGLFTKKIPRPKTVTCLAFAINNDEILTGIFNFRILMFFNFLIND